MRMLPIQNFPSLLFEVETNPDLAMREHTRRRQIVNGILVVIVLYQVVNFPGAVIMHSFVAVATVLLGLVLCGVAMLFNQLGKVSSVGLVLILVVDLGCGFLLLASPGGLDVGDLPLFNVLLVSELIAVSLLPAVIVFPVAMSNIIFIVSVIALQPHTPALNLLLASDKGYTTVILPVSLQIVVAMVSFLWVRSALLAIARADRAEEIAHLQRRETELLRREAERIHELDLGSEHLLQVLVSAANGDHMVRANLPKDNVLWRVGNALNLVLARMRRANLAEYENDQLRQALARFSLIAKSRSQQSSHIAPRSSTTRQL
jgi:hypothetical protein